MLNHRKAFVVGALCGIAVAGAAAAMIGMGEQPAGPGEYRITSSADGRTCYLWSVGGGKVGFVSSAHAPKGQGDEGEDHGKPEDKGKPDDKGGGKGKDKGKN